LRILHVIDNQFHRLADVLLPFDAGTLRPVEDLIAYLTRSRGSALPTKRAGKSALGEDVHRNRSGVCLCRQPSD
jgi:hypothetical protein